MSSHQTESFWTPFLPDRRIFFSVLAWISENETLVTTSDPPPPAWSSTHSHTKLPEVAGEGVKRSLMLLPAAF